MIDYTNTTLHFKLENEIGAEGKNSKVYIAHDYQLNAHIIVKQISKTTFKDASKFFNEAKLLYTSTHPNVAPIQYATQDSDFVYISMPFFSKGSLNKLIDSRPLKISEIIKYSIDFLSGLHFIHTKKLVHCDIKPTNILLSDSNDAILTDFGLANNLNDDGLTTFEKFYNFHTSPEAFKSNMISHHNDIYQAGLTIYRMCNGNIYFKNQLNKYVDKTTGSFIPDKYVQAVLDGKFPDRTQYLLHIPQKLRNYIRKALAVNVTDRYNSVLEFLNDLSSIEIDYDWEFSPQPDKEQWFCSKEEKEYIITLSPIDDKSCCVKTTKKTQNNPSDRQITDYCNKNLKFDEAYKLIKDALSNKSL